MAMDTVTDTVMAMDTTTTLKRKEIYLTEGKMEIKKTPLSDLLIIQPVVFPDERGYFFEAYNANALKSKGLEVSFVQDNISMSKKGVLRGIHFQKPPFAQGKLVQVLRGAVLDVAVDLRKNSPTYGKYYSHVL